MKRPHGPSTHQRPKEKARLQGAGVTWASFRRRDPRRDGQRKGVGSGTLRRQPFEAIRAPVPVALCLLSEQPSAVHTKILSTEEHR